MRLQDQIAKLPELQEAWLAYWDLVEGEEARSCGVESALPWRCLAMDHKEVDASHRSFVLPGLQSVLWLGFHPDHGLVHGERLWDPEQDACPPLPTDWTSLTYRTMRDRIWERDRSPEAPYSYALLPLPSRFKGEAGIPSSTSLQMNDFLSNVGNVPFYRFALSLGLPLRVLELMRHPYQVEDPERDPVASRFIRNRAMTGNLLWCAGNDIQGLSVFSWNLSSDSSWRPDPFASEPLPIPLCRARRVQAAMSMPCYAWRMPETEITKIIDGGRELVPYLAQDLDCQASTIRILGSGSARASAVQLSAMVMVAATDGPRRLLDTVPRSVLRDMVSRMSPQEWQGTKELAAEFYYPSGISSLIPQVGAALRPDRQGSWDWIVSPFGNRWGHMDDLAEEFSRDLIWPAEAAANPVAEAMSSRQRDAGKVVAYCALGSLGGPRLAAVLDASMAGALRRAVEVSAEGGDADTRWRVPAEPIVAHTGQVVRFLTTPRELAGEGLKLEHCVGDYADACATGRSAIMSIGFWVDGEWQPSSTVEICRSEDGDIPEVEQHYGHGNSLPPEADVEVLRRWVSGLGTGETLFDLDVLPPPSTLAHISHVLGNAWHTPELSEARWDRWRRILDVRQSTAGAFLQHVMSSAGRSLDNTQHAQDVHDLVQRVVEHDKRNAATLAMPPAPAAFEHPIPGGQL